MRLSDPVAEQRYKAILASVVEDNRINYLEIIKLPHADKIAIAKGLVKTGILTKKHKPNCEVYSINFKNLGKGKLPCLFLGTIDGNVTLFACSLEDASAMASSWNLTYSIPAYIDKIYVVGGKVITEEVPILENDFRGRNWMRSYAQQEQEKLAIGQT